MRFLGAFVWAFILGLLWALAMSLFVALLGWLIYNGIVAPEFDWPKFGYWTVWAIFALVYLLISPSKSQFSFDYKETR